MNDGFVMRHITKDITNEGVTEYLQKFYRPLTVGLADLRKECDRTAVPIILPETEDFLGTFLDIIRPERILEIGTSVGYSSMFFAEKMLKQGTADPSVYTVEKDPEALIAAVKNIERLGYSKYISVLEGDGEEAVSGLIAAGTKDFDLVFIDAAKSHYKRFLEASLKVLRPGGIVICDDTLFEGRPALDPEEPPRKHRTNVKALRDFNEYVSSDSRFSSTVMALGNGLTLIKVL